MAQTISYPKVFEGSWAEVSAEAERFADHQVRLIILPLDKPYTSHSSISAKIPGLIPPKIGTGTFEDIMRLNSFQESDDKGEDDIMEAIAENRAMRRQLAAEKLV